MPWRSSAALIRRTAPPAPLLFLLFYQREISKHPLQSIYVAAFWPRRPSQNKTEGNAWHRHATLSPSGHGV
jgi:hypothetical protein